MEKFLPSLLACCFLIACKEKAAEKQLERDGVQIAYNSYGSGDTTLLFVHGWCINKEYWQPQVDFFSTHYKVVTIDLPGFGQSGKNRTSWDFGAYTEDVKFVIEQLKLKNVIVIGHSMSGDILLDISSKYPQLVAGIIGVDNLHEPVGRFSEAEVKDINTYFSLFSSRFDSIATASMEQYFFQPSTDTAIRQRVMNDVLNADSLIAVEVIKSNTLIVQEEKTKMQQLKHKLYLVNSNAMPVKTDSLQKYCAEGVYVTYVDSTGHYPMLEKPGEFNEALLEIVKQIGR